MPSVGTDLAPPPGRPPVDDDSDHGGYAGSSAADRWATGPDSGDRPDGVSAVGATVGGVAGSDGLTSAGSSKAAAARWMIAASDIGGAIATPTIGATAVGPAPVLRPPEDGNGAPRPGLRGRRVTVGRSMARCNGANTLGAGVAGVADGPCSSWTGAPRVAALGRSSAGPTGPGGNAAAAGAPGGSTPGPDGDGDPTWAGGGVDIRSESAGSAGRTAPVAELGDDTAPLLAAGADVAPGFDRCTDRKELPPGAGTSGRSAAWEPVAA
jgi:hypothetical protein